jgi:hypothetical protein
MGLRLLLDRLVREERRMIDEAETEGFELGRGALLAMKLAAVLVCGIAIITVAVIALAVVL